MKRRVICATFGLLATMLVLPSSLVGPSHAQTIPGLGFSELVCQLGVTGTTTTTTFMLGNGEIIVTIVDNGVSDDIGTATVTIQHGETGSTHLLTYEDTDDDGALDCGDIILSVSR